MHNLSERVGLAHSKYLYRLSGLAVPLLFCAGVQAAVIPPDAGSLGGQLRQGTDITPPAPISAPLVLPDAGQKRRLPAGTRDATVVVNRIIFTDIPASVKGVDEAALQKQVAGYLRRPLTFTGLSEMTQGVTDLYRQKGLLVARAILPPQTIRDGVLTVQIIPGRYDSAQVSNASVLRSSVVARMVSTTTPQGEVVTRKQLERVALLLNEIPGVSASVSLKEGQKSGTSALDISVKPGKRLGGYVGLDNQGNTVTGRSRVMAGFYASELLGFGDQLRVDLLDAWENSDLFNGALDYSLLVGGAGTRVGASYSHLNYHYNVNGLGGFDGYSDNWGVYVTQPWIRTARARVDVRLDAGQQFLTDTYPQFFSIFASGERKSRKQVDYGSLSLLGSVASTPGGITAFNLQGTTGNMDYRNAAAASFSGGSDNDVTGQFSRLNWLVSHDQQVWGPFSFYASLNGQAASRNLDSSQKFLMGGPGAVRAYDVGDGSVDTGNVMTAEVRSDWAIPVTRWLGNDPKLTLATFYDYGHGKQNKNDVNQRTGRPLIGNDNSFSLAGAGLYATVADANNYALTMTWAHRTGDVDPVSGSSDHDRFWVTAVKTF
ncbi:ShlB/FhaC/HecB family hemolysin secretion/activation protein [Escherichia coli]|nr:ShlB/FhaC/HecB family hemolysin secretion/activation protein [Escherichia coli]EGA8974240.1 ShlB/FhaC/HecB family hemolysin secretion/activation protein [Escherichia coli]EJR8278300.1 ShlB/FhaC/HecB family hemolysin secretion/activation protein [Escherichia coli]HCP5918931.1 ShlB/FhaC/HecB family hemolysin secretion/activation protein [Escherichia coli]